MNLAHILHRTIPANTRPQEGPCGGTRSPARGVGSGRRRRPRAPRRCHGDSVADLAHWHVRSARDSRRPATRPRRSSGALHATCRRHRGSVPGRCPAEGRPDRESTQAAMIRGKLYGADESACHPAGPRPGLRVRVCSAIDGANAAAAKPLRRGRAGAGQ